MSQTVQITKSYQACYAHPIAINAGTEIYLTGRIDIWQGHKWLWAQAPDERQGWVPDTLVDKIQVGHRPAKFDYSAQELSCETNDILTRTHETHGWSWCVNSNGDAGWVPNQNLKTNRK